MSLFHLRYGTLPRSRSRRGGGFPVDVLRPASLGFPFDVLRRASLGFPFDVLLRAARHPRESPRERREERRGVFALDVSELFRRRRLSPRGLWPEPRAHLRDDRHDGIRGDVPVPPDVHPTRVDAIVQSRGHRSRHRVRLRERLRRRRRIEQIPPV